MSGSNLFTGTLDLLILRAVRFGPQHGYAIGRWLRDRSEEALAVGEGVLYPALHRLEARGLVESRWGESETGRRARLYSITPDGADELESEASRWRAHARAVESILEPRE